eukprot:4469646-Prymnesium_polylepis.1
MAIQLNCLRRTLPVRHPPPRPLPFAKGDAVMRERSRSCAGSLWSEGSERVPEIRLRVDFGLCNSWGTGGGAS